MGDGVGTRLLGDLDLPLGDEGAGDGGPQQVLPFVHGVGAEHGKDEIARELLAQVVDVDLLHPQRLGLGPRRLHFLALTDVGGERHHLAAIGLLQPFEDHRGVQAAGIGQHHFLHFAHEAPTRFPWKRGILSGPPEREPAPCSS